MRFRHFSFVFLTIISLSCAATKKLSTPSHKEPIIKHDESLETLINQILEDTLLSSSFVGIKTISLDNGETIYEKNSNKLFHPASNMKLFTTATALGTFDTNYLFTTGFYADADIIDDTINGNIYIKGGGDPLIFTKDLDSIAAFLSSRGIRCINGNLIGNVDYFDSVYWGHGWMWDDEPNPDVAYISPISINGNSIKIIVQSGRKEGNVPFFKIEPQTSYLSVQNHSITSSDTLIPPLKVTRMKGSNTILINGRISPNGEPQEFILSVSKPELYFLQLFKEALTVQGIELRGDLLIDSKRGHLKLAEISHPIDSVIHRINKQSDNLAAECLLKTLSAEFHGSPGSAKDGLSIIKEYLSSEQIDTTRMILADGSGVSWYNAVSPNAIVQLLKKQYEHKQTFERFLQSLPIAGVDGTLRHRLRETQSERNVRAKTGSLTGVSALSGYLTASNGKNLAFCILMNHFQGEQSILRNIQDKIVDLLTSYNGRSP